jgi:type VI protein secretion system component Hcp
MAAAILIPCLVRLRTEFNLVAPSRDKASDGWIGDTAHQHEVSDHNPDEAGSVPIHDADKVNEVHAIDVDNNLNESDLTMEKVVQFLLGRCRSGAEKRLRYIIYNRRIWEASNGWKQRTYTGASPHTEHAHFSASYTSKLEASTASWHLEDIPVALTAADKTWIQNTIKANVPTVTEVAQEVWRKARTSPEFLSDTEKNEIVDRVGKEVDAAAERVIAAVKPV